jgi:hypothetical protein
MRPSDPQHAHVKEGITFAFDRFRDPGALRLQSATIRVVTEMLHMRGILDPHDLVKIKELRDALAAEIRTREEVPQIVPQGREH